MPVRESARAPWRARARSRRGRPARATARRPRRPGAPAPPRRPRARSSRRTSSDSMTCDVDPVRRPVVDAVAGGPQQHEPRPEQVERRAAVGEHDVRRPRSRPAAEGGGREVQGPVVLPVGQDRRRAHDQPDLQLDVGDRRLHPVGAALGHDAGGVPRVRLLDVELAQRQALGLVAVQQRRVGVALDHRGQLPGEVERVLDAHVAAEAAVGRDDVRRVAGEEHAAVAEPLGAGRLGPPVGDVDDLHRHVGRRSRCAGIPSARSLVSPDWTSIAESCVTSAPTVLMTRKPVPPLRSSRKNPRSSGLCT